MFSFPEGPVLTPAQAVDLDDTYFKSRPYAYFASRVASLIEASECRKTEPARALGAEISNLLGLTRADGGIEETFSFNDSDRELQIATDSFALRHHAAEALVRLYHALTVGQNEARCVWASIAEGPVKTIDLVREAREHLSSAEGAASFWKVVFPEVIAERPELEAFANQSLNLVGDWLNHAAELLVRSDINVNAAHNKVKHGLAIRAREDLRMTFTTTPPNADGSVPLSALTGTDAVDIFDTVTLEYLARAPKSGGRRQGLEVTALRMDAATLLAETLLMATAHAAMFHVAAARHFAGRDATFQPFPRLPLGPTPAQLLGEAVVGIRYPITTPPDRGAVDRRTGIGFRTAFIPLDVDYSGVKSGRVVDG